MQALRSIIKSVLHRVAPGLSVRLRAYTQSAHQRRFERSQGLPKLVSQYVARNGLTIRGGPFEGMSYLIEAAGSTLLPKLAGSYEAELFGVIAAIAKSHYRCVIDVGCAEGYYAVGLAMKIPSARVVAFDINPRARLLCQRLAELNGVAERVAVMGACEPQTLVRVIDGPTLLVCDCEGYEVDLLDPVAVPQLQRVDVLVELHDFLRPGARDAIVNAFGNTHAVQIIDSTERDPSAYPAVAEFSEDERRLALNEFRPARQQWAWLKANLPPVEMVTSS